MERWIKLMVDVMLVGEMTEKVWVNRRRSCVSVIVMDEGRGLVM